MSRANGTGPKPQSHRHHHGRQRALGAGSGTARGPSATAPARVRSTRSIECLPRTDGIGVLTLFAFSSENWNRPTEEVGGLMKLFLGALEREVDELHRLGARLRFIGERSRFDGPILARMQAAEALTAGNTRLQPVHRRELRGALGHRARRTRRWPSEVAAGRLRARAASTKDALSARSWRCPTCPRRSLHPHRRRALRISNFLLWQLAYCELHFTDIVLARRGCGCAAAPRWTDYAGRERRLRPDQPPRSRAGRHRGNRVTNTRMLAALMHGPAGHRGVLFLPSAALAGGAGRGACCWSHCGSGLRLIGCRRHARRALTILLACNLALMARWSGARAGPRRVGRRCFQLVIALIGVGVVAGLRLLWLKLLPLRAHAHVGARAWPSSSSIGSAG
jgi:undecaprenyl diphosphate synthase